MRSKPTNAAIQAKRWLSYTAGALALGCALAGTVSAQSNPSQPPSSPAPTPPAQTSSQAQPAPGSAKESLGPTADSIRPYRPYNRDPFKKALKPKTPKDKAKQMALQLGFPLIDARRAEFRQKVNQAHGAGVPEPPPVTQYLVSELDVTGVFRDDRGFGAFVKAQPTGTMLFMRSGEHCYNGEVVRIEGDDAASGAARVMFREFFNIEQAGKAVKQERMVVKTPSASPVR